MQAYTFSWAPFYTWKPKRIRLHQQKKLSRWANSSIQSLIPIKETRWRKAGWKSLSTKWLFTVRVKSCHDEGNILLGANFHLSAIQYKWILCQLSHTRTRGQVKSSLNSAVWLWDISSASMCRPPKKAHIHSDWCHFKTFTWFILTLNCFLMQRAESWWHIVAYISYIQLTIMLQIHYSDENLLADETCAVQCRLSHFISALFDPCFKINLCHVGLKRL